MGNRGFYGFSNRTEGGYIASWKNDLLALPGIRILLEADAITGKSDGDAVATWSDMSGNGNDAVQMVGGAQPLYKTNIQNGLPVLRFDGSDDFMTLPFGTSGIGTSFTIVMAFKLLRTNVNQVLLRERPYQTFGTGLHAVTANNSGFYRMNNTVMGISTSVASEFGTAPQVVIYQKVQAMGYVYLNGIVRGSAEVGATLSATNEIDIADNANYNNSYAQMDWFAFLLYARGLASYEIADITQYFKSKWGTT